MATNNGRGIPALPSTLIRPTSPVEHQPEQAEPEEVVEPVEQSRGDARAAAAVAAAKPRRRRPVAPVEKTSKRGVYLTDSVWDRLQYEAIRRRTTVSAIAGDVLERNLPRFQVTREG